MDTILANLENKKQEQIQINIQHVKQTEHIKRIQTLIDENEQALTRNEINLIQANLDKTYTRRHTKGKYNNKIFPILIFLMSKYLAFNRDNLYKS